VYLVWVQSDPTCPAGRNSNSEDLPHWPVFNWDEQYLQLDIQPTIGQALKASKLKIWTKILPQEIQELMGAE
jgi:hypothetical protein